MIVANKRRTKTMEMRSFGRGNDEASIEFTAPAREKGTKTYRKGDEMWMYMPAVERTQKISGHMLRQGMMGSDVSYEDMSGNTEWQADYDGTVEGAEDIDGRKHFKVVLKAKNDEVTYDKRVTFIDAETLIPTRQELYAISGMLVKTWEMSDVKEIDGRMYPMKMRIEDKLKDGTYTEIVTTELKFGVDVPGEVFSVRWLERG
jgi:outer membrane lipoprotein-sorting protein